MNFRKDIHFSTDLEQAVLGACLLETTAFGRVYGIVTEDVFYHDGHKIVFKALFTAWENNEPVDTLTLILGLCRAGNEHLEGFPTPFYICRITNAVVSTANLEYHALILRQLYVERETIKIKSSGFEQGKDALEELDDLQEQLRKLRTVSVKDDFRTLDEVLVDMYKHMDLVKDKDLVGITTGFKNLDKITGGLMPGGTYIVAARPSVGKSAFMGKMVLGAGLRGHNVGVISLEMKDKDISARLASLVTEVEFWRIQRNRMADERQSEDFYEKVNRKMSSLPIRISDTASVNIGDIKAKVARLKQRGQIDVLFIDYLGLIDTDGSNRNYNRGQEVSKISRGIKLMAMQYEIPVVLLCQLNRGSEEKKEKPKLHNLRESGSIEQDADGVIFLHRDFMSGNKTNADGGSTENEADIIVAKWRNGEVCEYKIGFDGQRMKFYELDDVPGNWMPLKDITEPKRNYLDETPF